MFEGGEWWATLESNQAWVSPAELQSAAAPCSTSPDALRGIAEGGEGVKAQKRGKSRLHRGAIRGQGCENVRGAGDEARKQETHLGDR